MKFKFSLEKVLNHRQLKLDLARKDYNEVQEFYRNETEILENYKKEEVLAQTKMNQNVNSLSNWQNENAYLNDFIKLNKIRMQKQTERLAKIEKLVEQRLEILKEALKDVKILEELKQKKKSDFIKNVQYKEQLELDELSVLRFKNEDRVDE